MMEESGNLASVGILSKEQLRLGLVSLPVKWGINNNNNSNDNNYHY